ncbi:transmembrane protein 165-like isoform X1 [Pollicipes pollicipes]|uniref:transmembrane protein 165-like isoform X1 n=1 Tax=Pollicipes pollicipes TaxID=41117 RepID=UPI001884CD82|nr:transmembrane protein 165-like isoform X1 [Pollicipes pollicipes]XP_037076262.1 transmembrane protein 165-like isoform X1 [Pollicipes pollicipes]
MRHMKLDMKQVLFCITIVTLVGCTAAHLDAEHHTHASSTEKVPVTVHDGSPFPPAATAALDVGFAHGFVAAFSVIIVSELGDKTFFIAAIMAMRHPPAVLLGAVAALFAMTVLSVLLGFSAQVIPRLYTYYISSALFALFGFKMLYDGIRMGQNEAQEEFEEVQTDLRKREDERSKTPLDVEAGRERHSPLSFVSGVFLEAFTLTFLAEWGDRSQIATILLAAREVARRQDAWGVTLGSFLGHSLCTLLAVVGGRLIAQRISAKTVTLLGGVVFLVFAVSALFISPDS